MAGVPDTLDGPWAESEPTVTAEEDALVFDTGEKPGFAPVTTTENDDAKSSPLKSYVTEVAPAIADPPRSHW